MWSKRLALHSLEAPEEFPAHLALQDKSSDADDQESEPDRALAALEDAAEIHRKLDRRDGQPQDFWRRSCEPVPAPLWDQV